MGGEGLNAGRIKEVTMKNFIDRMIGQPLQDFYLKFREFLPNLFSALVIFFIIALNALKLPAVDQLLERFLLYLPNVFIAAFLLIVGVLIGNFLGRAALIASVNAGIKQSGLLSRAVKTTVVLFAFVMAMEQLGIGRQAVLAAFTIVFGGLGRGPALGFGLEGK